MPEIVTLYCFVRILLESYFNTIWTFNFWIRTHDIAKSFPYLSKILHLGFHSKNIASKSELGNSTYIIPLF